MHTGTTRQVHRLREMGQRHPLRAPGQYPIPTGTPYKVDDAKFKADLEEVKKLAVIARPRRARTDEQTQIALFWLESSPLK